MYDGKKSVGRWAANVPPACRIFTDESVTQGSCIFVSPYEKKNSAKRISAIVLLDSPDQ
jgi:hypothetical protein